LRIRSRPGGIEISDHLRHVLEERLEIVDRLAYGDLGEFPRSGC